MTRVKVWIEAFRLRTLPLALSCVGMGAFLAAAKGAFQWPIFLLCFLTTLLLQILSNLANDYGDTIHGADHDQRIGPIRAVQSGAISPGVMKKAIGLFVVLSLASGVGLLYVALGWEWQTFLFFLGLGLFSLVAAIAYTNGKRPYGYAGLGDLSVLLFFGLAGVMGTFYLFTKKISWLELLPALSCGFFSIGVLNLNNIRDIESDRKAGKHSIPVRIGRNLSIFYHWSLLSSGFLSALVYVLLTNHNAISFLFLCTLPLFFRNAIRVKKYPPSALNPYLRELALSTLIFVLFFGLGQIFTHG